MPFKVQLESNVIIDLQKAIDYYDEQKVGLGKRFEKTINKHFISLVKNPFYQVRYDDIRCLPVKKFPFMIHFVVDESNQIIRVFAVLHTSINPDRWGEK